MEVHGAGAVGRSFSEEGGCDMGLGGCSEGGRGGANVFFRGPGARQDGSV